MCYFTKNQSNVGLFGTQDTLMMSLLLHVVSVPPISTLHPAKTSFKLYCMTIVRVDENDIRETNLK